MFKKGTIWWSVLVCIVILVVLLPLLYIGGRAVVMGIGSYYSWGFGLKTEVPTEIACNCNATEESSNSDVTATPLPEVEVIDETCIAEFVDAGASYSLAKAICSDDDDDGYAWRLEAGQHCDGWGTVVYDNDSDVEIMFDFDAPIIASYSYCYPDGSDIRNAPFFVGAELNPFGNPFDIVFVEN